MKQLDVRLFLKVSYDLLKARREQRFGYHTQVLFQPEGSLWRDPPGYWDNIVWPAYVKAHRNMGFGIVERSGTNSSEETSPNIVRLGGVVDRLQVYDAEKLDMAELFERSCQAISQAMI